MTKAAVKPWPTKPGTGTDALLRESFDVLRRKWGEVPGGQLNRVHSTELLKLAPQDLLDTWSSAYVDASLGDAFAVRGWYQLLYRDVFRDRKILDVGCGLAIDTITYAEHGADVTFVDVVQANVEVVRRLCHLKGLSRTRFLWLQDLSSLNAVPTDYDFIYCCGSLINAPMDVIRLEARQLVKHLSVGGRWIELAYPKARWEREGSMPFERWGEKTDGGAPWMEWRDLEKIRWCLAPAVFETVLETEFHNHDFNWFDLVRRA
jgi:2-polyprenyl-3-methyl-5-hydroxy-6-metoxy-1,4-benzoquinol methylase